MKQPETILQRVKTIALDLGFNIFRTIKTEDYDMLASADRSIRSIFPWARSATLIGFGGNEFWEVLKSYIQTNPDFKDRGEDLIDNYTLMVFEKLSKVLSGHGVKNEAVYPFGKQGTVMDFVKLGQACGAGVPSILGILINPEFGPWLSLRGALLSELEPKDYDGALTEFNPCPGCHKPCIAACPAGTVSESGWDWEACMKYRMRESTCTGNCASRRACPYGRETQYSEEQLAYHHGFVLRSVRSYFKEDPA